MILSNQLEKLKALKVNKPSQLQKQYLQFEMSNEKNGNRNRYESNQ